MSLAARFLEQGEFAAAGLFEEPNRSLFYRKALGLRRYWETCPLMPYEGKPLYPSGKIPANSAIVPQFMSGFTVDQSRAISLDPELLAAYRTDFERFRSHVPFEHTVTGNMAEHSIPLYERVLAEGLLAYIPRIEAMKDRELREGLLHIVAGIRCWVERCVAYLRSVQAEERLIRGLEQVPLYPARDVFEAVLSWNAVMYLDGCDNLGCVASGLLPYHRGEDITPLLANLFDNLDVNNGYSMALNMDYSPLTLQCLEASKGKRRPMIQLFVDETTPDAVWEKAFEVIRTQNGQPAFYNPKGLLGGLKQRLPELTDEDLKKFCGSGCTESQIAGYTNVGSVDAGMNILLVFARSLHLHLRKAQSFEAFYEAFMTDVKREVDAVTAAISLSQRERAIYSPLPMRTLLVDDCIDKELDFNNGGARFGWSLISFAGMINVIDSLLVVRDFLFEKPRYTADTFLQLLKDSDEAFLQECRNHSVTFGNDNPDANAMASRVSTDIYSMLDTAKPYFGSAFLPCSIMFRSAAPKGKEVGATPDGRSKGAPLCDSLGAIFGKDTKGPTALLRSVTALDLKRALGTPVLNFCISPDMVDSYLKALVLAYIQMGGLQMQISCADGKTLQEAYDHPERHRNLVVRVGGFSDYFCNLTDEMKRVIMARTVHQ